MGMSDVENCIHRMRFDECSELAEVFAYPPLRVSYLGVTYLGGLTKLV